MLTYTSYWNVIHLRQIGRSTLKVACITMQKNEGQLLKQWIEYHADLFGKENLFIFDNASEDPDTISVLDDYQRKGVRVNRDYSAKEDFEKKGTIIGNLIKELSRERRYDIYMPLDTDEFVGVSDDLVGFNSDRTTVVNELSRHSGEQRVCFIKGTYYNIPMSSMFYFRGERKCFFGSQNFGSLDIGFHWGKSCFEPSEELGTLIVHAHFQNKPFLLLREHAAEKLKLRVKSMSPEYLATYKGPGVHLAKYFLIDEGQYLKSFSDLQPRRELPSLVRSFELLGLTMPFV
jgi:Glycosyl transferase family 2